MIVTISYNYRANVVHKRHRKSELVYYRDQTPVEIQEISGMEAPVALRYDDRSHALRSQSPAENIVELRWREGRLYERSPIPVDEVRARIDDEMGVLRDNIENGNFKGTPFKPRYRDQISVPRSEDRFVTEFQSSDEEDVVAEIRRQVNDIIIIDGEIWSVTDEPLLKMERADLRRPCRVEVVDLEYGPDIFRFDESFMIEELYADDFEHHGNLPNIIPFHEVLIPECQRERTTDRAILEAAFQLYKDMRNHVAEADENYFAAYKMFRDLLKPFRSNKGRGGVLVIDIADDPCQDDPNMNVTEIAIAAERALKAHLSVFPGDLGDWSLQAIRRAIRRSELRASRIEEQLDFSM